ncbi:hypothetical protein B0J11DRAFT_611747 [Dendryphion nanum]|uniref:Uncharacterized protein n=1 Tax=Dendryphion nanum TaxID=256645 RepID=A0A9P9IYR4_9PLEO|nr:hypothetical protein B0J11DRAFT_611747 [Dendryphion nanum]
MIRLRQSEIDLTPTDVEETLRHMARRRAVIASTGSSQTVANPSYQSQPRLRRGPQHSRDTAMVQLGEIPVFLPHQVAESFSSPDDDDNEPKTIRSSPTDTTRFTNLSVTDSAPTISTIQPPCDGISEHSLHSPSRHLQLPFRLTQRDSSEVEASSAHLKHASDISAFGRTRNNTPEETTEIVTHSRLPEGTDGSTDLSSIVPKPTEPFGNLSEQQHNHGTSSLSYGQSSIFISPERDVHREHQRMSHTEPRPQPSRAAPRIRTMSSSSDPSQLHPLPPARRSQIFSAEDVFWTPSSHEGGTEHEDRFAGPTDNNPRSAPRLSFDERLRRHHRRIESIEGRYRDFFQRRCINQFEHNSITVNKDEGQDPSQRASEASSTSSLAYSYYELPASRYSSSNRSHSGDQLSQSQFDGAAPSRQFNRGAYYSIRPSQVRSTNAGLGRPLPERVSSFSSPNLLLPAGQHGLSPLPARPYTRAQGWPSPPTPSINLLPPGGFIEDDLDASDAIAQNIPSPLEMIEHSAISRLIRLGSVEAHGGLRSVSGNSAELQNSVARYPNQYHHHRGGPAPEGTYPGHRQDAHLRVPRVTHYADVRPHRVPERIPPPPRNSGRTRRDQRSSENVPVASFPHDARSQAHIPQGPTQRVSFGQYPRVSRDLSMRSAVRIERPPSTAPNRPSVPPPPTISPSPRDISNRSHPLPPYQRRLTVRSPLDHSRSDEANTEDVPSTTHNRADVFHARNSATLYPLRPQEDLHHHPHLSRYHSLRSASPFTSADQRPSPRDHAIVPPMHHRFSEHVPLEAHRRPPQIPARFASRRRISAQLANQENEGGVEERLMREELGRVGMRFGGLGGGNGNAEQEQEGERGGGLEVLDDTPPRVGRFERRVLESEGEVSRE